MKFLAPAFLLAFAAPARADDAPTPPATPSVEDVSLAGFGAQNADCREWTDSCAICRRDDAGAAHCSTPGIACQPQPIACTKAKTP